ncbi:MAG: hypothetical protein ACFFC7_09975 [Candidatus Hermodarchaeota archaeon]
MSEIEKLDVAFQLLKRYEEYLLKKAWGILLILSSILFLVFLPLDFLTYFLPSEQHFNFYSGLFMSQIIITIILALIIILYILFKFMAIKRIMDPKEAKPLPRYINFRLGLSSLVFLPVCVICGFFLARLLLPLFEYYEIVVYIITAVIAGAVPFIASYSLLKKIVVDGEFKEFLVLGLFLFIVGTFYLGSVGIVQNVINFLTLGDYWLSWFLSILFNRLFSFALLFICGLYLLEGAKKTLEGKL